MSVECVCARLCVPARQIQRIGDASGVLQALRIRFERIRVRYGDPVPAELSGPLQAVTGTCRRCWPPCLLQHPSMRLASPFTLPNACCESVLCWLSCAAPRLMLAWPSRCVDTVVPCV